MHCVKPTGNTNIKLFFMEQLMSAAVPAAHGSRHQGNPGQTLPRSHRKGVKKKIRPDDCKDLGICFHSREAKHKACPLYVQIQNYLVFWKKKKKIRIK